MSARSDPPLCSSPPPCARTSRSSSSTLPSANFTQTASALPAAPSPPSSMSPSSAEGGALGSDIVLGSAISGLCRTNTQQHGAMQRRRAQLGRFLGVSTCVLLRRVGVRPCVAKTFYCHGVPDDLHAVRMDAMSKLKSSSGFGLRCPSGAGAALTAAVAAACSAAPRALAVRCSTLTGTLTGTGAGCSAGCGGVSSASGGSPPRPRRLAIHCMR